MVEFFSFSLGVVSSLFVLKLAKIGYRVYPYMTRSRLLSPNTQNQYIIIAGATDGIGLEYVRHLSQSYKIIALGRNPKKLEEIKQISSSIITSRLDFSENCLNDTIIEQQVTTLMSLSQIEKMKIKGIVNSVGVAMFSPFHTAPLSDFVKINHVNIQSQLFLLKLLYAFKKNECLAANPFFINISSGAANYPNKFSTAYSASKAYISNVMKVLAKQDTTIHFLDIKPWFVKTKMVGYANHWDTILPQEVVKGSLKLLGKRTEGSGTPKHELIEQFRHICLRIISKRLEQQQARLEKIKAIKNKRKSNNNP